MASTINISLPDDLKAYVDSIREEPGDSATSEYICSLIALDRELRRNDLEQRLLESLADEENAIEIPEDVLESGDIIAFLESALSPLKKTA